MVTAILIIGLASIFFAVLFVTARMWRMEKLPDQGDDFGVKKGTQRLQASPNEQSSGNRSERLLPLPSLENHLDQSQKNQNDDFTEKIAASMLGFLTSHADFDNLRSILSERNIARPDILLGEFIFFRYFTLSHHANRQIADERLYARLMTVFLQKIKTCYRLNPTLRTIDGSFEKFEEETRRRNDLLANGIGVIKGKEPGGADDARAALASFLITLRILHPQLAIDRGSIPPMMIALMQNEFRLIADRMKMIVQSAAI